MFAMLEYKKAWMLLLIYTAIIILLHETDIDLQRILVRRDNHELNLSENALLNIKKVLIEPKVDAANLHLLVFILTMPDNKERRDALRSTWANCSNLRRFSYESKYIPDGINCRTIFVTGRSINRTVITEAQTQGDVLMFDYIETYITIHYKTISMYHWALKLSPKWIFKADDDLYVNLPRLILQLSFQKEENFYGGHIFKRARVPRNNPRISVPTSAYNGTHFPPFCYGFAVAVSGNLPQRFLLELNFYHVPFLDDAYLGVLLHRAGVFPKQLANIFIVWKKRPHFKDTTLLDGIVFAHNLLSADIRNIHLRIQNLQQQKKHQAGIERIYTSLIPSVENSSQRTQHFLLFNASFSI